MPKTLPSADLIPAVVLVFLLISLPQAGLFAEEGIQQYYLRYDVKYKNNTIIDENLLMVPAKNEFRAENFSQHAVDGVISAASGVSAEITKKKIQEAALKSILLSHGLKSINAKDLETVISYEGVIRTPLKISYHHQTAQQGKLAYSASFFFSPLEFPDKWEWMRLKHSIKNSFKSFVDLLR